jgi:hypothetical protein
MLLWRRWKNMRFLIAKTHKMKKREKRGTTDNKEEKKYKKKKII